MKLTKYSTANEFVKAINILNNNILNNNILNNNILNNILNNNIFDCLELLYNEEELLHFLSRLAQNNTIIICSSLKHIEFEYIFNDEGVNSNIRYNIEEYNNLLQKFDSDEVLNIKNKIISIYIPPFCLRNINVMQYNIWCAGFKDLYIKVKKEILEIE